jgi:branched-chain amino acid aminotransferase
MDKLGLKVEERDVLISGLDEFEEIGACGTAAAVTPIFEIVYRGRSIYLKEEYQVGELSKKLSNLIHQIQLSDIVPPDGWIKKIS